MAKTDRNVHSREGWNWPKYVKGRKSKVDFGAARRSDSRLVDETAIRATSAEAETKQAMGRDAHIQKARGDLNGGVTPP